MWEYLQEEAVDHPGSEADKWFQDMLGHYGDMTKFPHIGCGANFIPYARGPSMVCEIQMRQNAGEWEAFLADQTPQALDGRVSSEGRVGECVPSPPDTTSA